MFGPIFQLKLYGCLCPCLSSEYDRIAREALSELENLPIAIFYSEANQEEEVPNTDDSISGAVGKIATRLWKGTQNKLVGKRWKRSIGTFTIIDSTQGPVIRIQYRTDDTALLSDAQGDASNAENGLHEKFIQLGKVSGVKECSAYLPVRYSGILLFGKNSKSDHTKKNPTEELLRFEIRANKDDMSAATIDRRNEILEYLRIMLLWDKRRRNEDGEEEEDDTAHGDEEQEESAVDDNERVVVEKKSLQLTNSVKNEKLITEREIELQNRRREREQRKARYLKEAGGLKYTALVMANKS